MKYMLAVVGSLFASTALVWAGSLVASCGNWSTTWLCRVGERVGGAMLAPGIMTQLYSGSKIVAYASDTLFYATIFSLISCFCIQRRRRLDRHGSPCGH